MADSTIHGLTQLLEAGVAPASDELIVWDADAATSKRIIVNQLCIPSTSLSTDGTLAANSDSLVPSQKAVKTYAGLHGGGTWGSITGTLASQSDLNNALNLRVVGPSSASTSHFTLFSGTGGHVKNSVFTTASTFSSPGTLTKIPLTKAVVDYAETRLGDASAPSPTEFSYVKGLTSAAQTQLSNNNLAITTGTNPGHGHIVSAIDSGAADAMVGTYSAPAFADLTDGMEVMLVAAHANATTTPTFQYNALVAKTIVKAAATALAAGDIPGAGYPCHLRYNQVTDKWQLLNPWGGAVADIGVSFTDNTTGDVSSASHGFQKKCTTAAQALGTGDAVNFDKVTASGDGHIIAGGAYRTIGVKEQALTAIAIGMQMSLNSATMSGASYTFSGVLPVGLILDVTAYNAGAITSDGVTKTYSVGDGITVDKWGGGIPFTLNNQSSMAGYNVATIPFYNKTAGDVVITPAVGNFTGGTLRLLITYIASF